jgi:leader peptidase (prepilin peptidase)/N-methyltransferase
MIGGFTGAKRWLAAATLLTAATLAATVWRFGFSAQLPAFAYFALVSVPLAFTDARERRLPDVVTLPSYVAAALLLGMAALAVPAGGARLLHAAAGMGAALVFFAALVLVSPRGLGLGDVKLAGLCGGYLGWLSLTAFIAGMLAAWLLAALTAVGLLLARRATRRSEIPFGPFLIAATLLAVLAAPVQA